MEIVEFSICPSDSNLMISAISNFILKTKGGDGVVRELLDLILKNNENKYIDFHNR